MRNETTVSDRIDLGDGTMDITGIFQMIEDDGITLQIGIRAHFFLPISMTDDEVITYLIDHDFKQYYI